jgi:hypothetical protein
LTSLVHCWLLPAACSPQRWSLHHELQLFERVLRRTPPPDKQAAAADMQQQQQSQQQQQQQQQHPFTPHLEWSLLPVAAITRCLHGMYTADVQVTVLPAGSSAARCSHCFMVPV